MSVIFPSFIKTVFFVQSDGFFLLVSYIQHRDSEFLVNLKDIPEHLHPKIRILVRKIFVYKKDFGMEYNSPRQRDSLFVRRGEELDLLIKDICDAEKFCRFLNTAVDHCAGEVAQPQPQRDVIVYIKMSV